MSKKYPYCGSNKTKKKGFYNNQRQRYRCTLCGKQFQNHSRNKRLEKTIWKQYVYQRQTIRQLTAKYMRGKNWIRARLMDVPAKEQCHVPQSIVAIADVTFFKRSFGICVIRAYQLKKNMYAQKVQTESVDADRQGRTNLEKPGYTFKAIVLDGRPGQMPKITLHVFLSRQIHSCKAF
jgi:hypothetical protein